jgi:hypothetical protein
MIKSSLDAENNVPTPESKLLGLSRPIAGALPGVLLFAALLYLTNLGTSLSFLRAVLLSGSVPVLIFGWFLIVLFQGMSLPSMVVPAAPIAIYVLSSIPYAILSSLLFSKEKVKQTKGLSCSAIYLVISLILGTLTYVIGSLFPG